MFKYEKYLHVLDLLTQVPQCGWNLPVNGMTADQATDCWDHIFQYIFPRFEAPAQLDWGPDKTHDPEVLAQYKECDRLLRMGHSDRMLLLECIPPQLLDVHFPVVVAINLLRDRCIPLDHRKCRTFTEFHKRYGTMILWH